MDCSSKRNKKIFSNSCKMRNLYIASVSEVARKGFSNILINIFKKLIISTSTNIGKEEVPGSLKEISKEILKGVDYVVNLPNECKNAEPSSIIKLSNDGLVKVIRGLNPKFNNLFQKLIFGTLQSACIYEL